MLKIRKSSKQKQITKHIKKLTPFLCTLLVSTTFINATYGMMGPDWPDLFDPEDKKKIGCLGLRIFFSFDAPTVDKAAQVNWGWNWFAQLTREDQAPHRPWFLTRSMFEAKIKGTLQAEEDPLTPLLFALREAPFFEHVFLKNKFIRILPKDLLDEAEQKDFLLAPVQTRTTHPYLTTFTAVLAKLRTFSHKDKNLEALAKEYERLLDGLLGNRKELFTDPQATLQKILKEIDSPKNEILALVPLIEQLPFVEEIFPTDKTFRCYFDEVIQLWEKAWNTPKLPLHFFTRLDTIIDKLAKETSSEYQLPLTALFQVYKDFKQKISELSSKERSRYLKRSRIKADFSSPWFVNEDNIEKVFSICSTGDLILEGKLGSSWVKPYPKTHPQFYFKYCKFNDLLAYQLDSAFQPGMERGMYALSQILKGGGIVPSSFLILNKNVKVSDLSDVTAKRKRELDHPSIRPPVYEVLAKELEDFSWESYSYGIQITPAVSGLPLMSFLMDNPNFTLDLKSYSHHILFGLIAKPADYKGDNLLVNQFGEIIGIDNDLAFASPIVGTAGGIYTEFKHLLFCLPQMGDVVHQDVIDSFKTLTPEAVVMEFLGALFQQNKRYEVLLRDQEVSSYIQGRLQLPLKLHPQTIPQMLGDLHTLKRLLTKDDVTHQDLFSGLFPSTASYYSALVKKYGILRAWEIIYGGAAHQGNEESFNKVVPDLKQFLDQGPLPNIGDSRQRTLLPEQAADDILRHIARASVSLVPNELNDCVEKILRYFPHELEKHFDKNELLRCLEAQFPSERLIQFLIQRFGKDVTNEAGETFLHLAIKHNHVELLKKLLDQGVPYHHKDKLALTPLDAALRQTLTSFDVTLMQKHHERVKCLIDKGAATSMNASIGLAYYRKHNNTHQDIITSLLNQHMEFAWLVALEEILPPRGRGLLIRGATLGPRLIPDAIHKQLYSKKGMIKKTTTGRHCVSYVSVGPHTLYFKEYPEIPGFEEAVGSLGRLLFGDLTPYGELFEIYGKPVLVSFGIPGESFQDTIKFNPLCWNKLDHEQLVSLTLLSFLTNPEDGKPDNLQLWNNKLYSIDNDHSFVQPVAKEEKGLFQKWFQGPLVQVKTMLYSMEHMHKAIPESLRQKLLNFDIGQGLSSWLVALKSKTQDYHLLFDDMDERMKLFDKEKCYLGFPFDQKKIGPLYEKIIALKDLVYHEPNITFFEILKKLEQDLSGRYNPTLTTQMVNNFSAKVGQFYEKYVPQGEQEAGFKQEFFSSLQILKQSIGLKLFDAVPAQGNLWKMYIRFLFVDGEFYLSDKKGSLTTLSTSKDLLCSQDIPWKEGLLSSIRNPNLDNAKLAQEALSTLMAKQAQIEGVPLHEIRDDHMLEKKLKKARFQDMGATQQLEIIKTLKTRNLSKISLRNSSVTDEMIRDFLNFSSLKHLDLRGCKNITSGLFSILSQKATVLELLNCARTNIKAIGEQYQPIEFKTLKFLNLDSCSPLTQLYLKAPLLKGIALEGCPNLDAIQCQGALERISLGGTPYVSGNALSGNKLRQLINEHPALQQVEFGKRLVSRFFLKSMPNSFQGAVYSFLNGKVLEDEVWLMSYLNSSMKDLRFNLINLNRKLGDVEIKKLIPMLQPMTQLTSLDLSWPHISAEGAQAIAQYMTQLTSLNLRDNKIGDIGARSIAQYMTQLTSLKLKHNQIGDAGAQDIAQYMTQLKGLNLRSNKIGDIGAQAIAQYMTRLTSLFLHYNQIAGAGAIAIAQSMMQLKELKLWGNQIGDIGAQAVAQFVTQLTSLNLGGNQIGDGGAQAIAQYMTRLTSLFLHYNQIAGAGAIAIAQSMMQLKGLNLRSNKIGDIGAQAIAQFMTQLTRLDLENNQIGDKGAQAIAQYMTQLKMLNLQFNQIADGGAQAIAQYMTQLKMLNLQFNQIADGGAQAIAQYMRQLTRLNLECNKIGDGGAQDIAQYMRQLTRLNLRDNKIGDGGAQDIAQYMPQLKELNLGSNQIGDAGALAIAQYMRQLKELYLRRNQIGDAGALAIAQYMRQLTHLDLGYNQIGDGGAQAIAQYMTKLTSLDLWGNPIENKDLLELPSPKPVLSQKSPEKAEILPAPNSKLTEIQKLNLWGKD